MIETSDKCLLCFLETTLNKNKKNINEEDLAKIKVLHLDSFFIDGTKNKIDFSKLSLFKNLEEITISNTILSTNDIEYLKNINIKSLNLKKCTFDNIDSYSIINKLEKLSLYNCYIDDYDIFLENTNKLIHLQIINPYDEDEIDINKVPTLLKVLILEGCIIKNIDNLKGLKECEILSLLNTYLGESDLMFLKEMPNLKQLYISDDYKLNEQICTLKNKINVAHDLRNLTFYQE